MDAHLWNIWHTDSSGVQALYPQTGAGLSVKFCVLFRPGICRKLDH